MKKFKKQHGKILSDGEQHFVYTHSIIFYHILTAATFSSFLLSPSGNKLLYIAEKVEPKAIAYFDTQGGKKYCSSWTIINFVSYCRG